MFSLLGQYLLILLLAVFMVYLAIQKRYLNSSIGNNCTEDYLSYSKFKTDYNGAGSHHCEYKFLMTRLSYYFPKICYNAIIHCSLSDIDFKNIRQVIQYLGREL